MPPRALTSLFRELLAIGDPDDLLTRVLSLCRNSTGADEVAFALVEGDELVEHVVDGKKLRKATVRLKIGEQGIGGWCAAKRRTVIVPDVSRDKRYVQASRTTRSEAAVPIHAGSRLLGVLNFESSKRGFFRAKDRGLLELLASQLAIGLRLDELQRERSRLALQLGMLNNLGRAGTTMEPRAFLDRAVDAVRRTFECAYVGLFLGDYPRERLVLLAQSSSLPVDCAPGYTRGFKGGMVGEAFRLGETVNARDVRKDPNYLPFLPGILSEIDVPVRAGDRCIGILDAQSVHLGAFTEDEVQSLETLTRFLVPKLELIPAL